MLEDSTALQFLSRFGYLAVLAGSGIQNATIVLLAGYLAQRGYLSLPLALVCACAGSALAAQGLFYLSRLKGAYIFRRFPKIALRADALCRRVSEMPRALAWFTLVFRWLYGLKNASPLFLGRTAIGAPRFAILNLIGAAFWALATGLAGFWLAGFFADALGSTLKYELLGMLALIALPALFALVRLRRAAARQGRTARPKRGEPDA